MTHLSIESLITKRNSDYIIVPYEYFNYEKYLNTLNKKSNFSEPEKSIMLRISGWKRQSVRKLAKPKNLDNSKTSRPARNQPKRNEKLSKTEQILNAYDRQVSQHLMISKERFPHMM